MRILILESSCHVYIENFRKLQYSEQIEGGHKLIDNMNNMTIVRLSDN